MEYVGYIMGLFFIGGAYWMTYINSPKYAYFLVGIVLFSFIIAQIKPIQMFSLLGIVACFVVMVKSQSARKKDNEAWFVSKDLRRIEVANTSTLFNHEVWGTNVYSAYQGKMGEVPFVLGIKYHSHRNNNMTSIEFFCSYYFYQNIDINTLEKKLIELKEQTPHTNFFKSQFRYFDMKSCEIFRPKMGGIVITWRVPDTVAGYNERYEWVKKALLN